MRLKLAEETDDVPGAQRNATVSKSSGAQAAAGFNQRGVALTAVGGLAGAIAAAVTALDIAPGSAALRFNLGERLEQHQTQASLDALRRALGLAPEDVSVRNRLAAALNARGVQLKASGAVKNAVEHYRDAVALVPSEAAIWSNLGNALVLLGQSAIANRAKAQTAGTEARITADAFKLLQEAVTCHRRALSLRPAYQVFRANLALGLNMLGAGFRLRGFPRRAVIAYRESVALDPGNASAWTSLGNALRDIRHLESAIRCHRRAIAVAPSVPALTANLGIALAAANRHDEAIACFDDVLAKKPSDANTRWDRGLSLLRLGRLAEGWADYEARFETGKLPKRELPGERWNGQPYPGQRLLLLSEQGIGDAIWTARYLPRVKALGGELIL